MCIGGQYFAAFNVNEEKKRHFNFTIQLAAYNNCNTHAFFGKGHTRNYQLQEIRDRIKQLYTNHSCYTSCRQLDSTFVHGTCREALLLVVRPASLCLCTHLKTKLAKKRKTVRTKTAYLFHFRLIEAVEYRRQQNIFIHPLSTTKNGKKYGN